MEPETQSVIQPHDGRCRKLAEVLELSLDCHTIITALVTLRVYSVIVQTYRSSTNYASAAGKFLLVRCSCHSVNVPGR